YPAAHAAHVHLEGEVADGRVAQVPGDPVDGGGAETSQDRVGQVRFDRLRGVDVDGGDVGPAGAEGVQTLVHDPHAERGLLGHRGRRRLAPAHDPSRVERTVAYL